MNFDLDLSIDVLARTPSTLQSLLSGLTDPWIRGTEGPDTFSPFDVVGHLIDGEETDWMPRARIILARGESLRFERYDRFRHRARNVNRSLQSLLDEFSRLRSENLAVLRSWQLTPSALDLPGRAPGARRRDAPAVAGRLGRPRSRTHCTDRARDGQAVRRRSRAVGALFTGPDRPFSPPVIDARPRGAMIVYAIAKYLVYSVWCYVGLRTLGGQMTPLRQALGLGAVRWSLGLVLGLVVFLASGSVDRSGLAVLYFGIYTPLRLFEWTVMTWLILRQHPQTSARARIAWVLGGLVISFATDAVSPDGLAGRFCVGRCLC